jgi:uncharacterized membrane protein HdeD (DUF308 family)
VSTTLTEGIHDHWRLFLIEGIVLGILGVAAIIVPPIAGLVATVFLAWLLLMAGCLALFSTFRARRAPGFLWSLLSAMAAVIAGGVLLWSPLRGMVALTFVLTAFFFVDGVLIIILALEHRRELTRRWQWMMVDGVIDLGLAGIIISGLPGTLLWALGLLVGIDMLFGGASLIAIALEARKEVLRSG